MTKHFAISVMILMFSSALTAKEYIGPSKAAMYHCYDTIMREMFSSGVQVTAENIRPNIRRRDKVADYWRVANGRQVLQLEVQARGRVVYYHMTPSGLNTYSCVPAQSRGLPQ